MNFDADMAIASRRPLGSTDRRVSEQNESIEVIDINLPSRDSQRTIMIVTQTQDFVRPPALVSAEPPAFVTKDDASEAQSAESTIYGGHNPTGGMAAKMQSAADKREHARRSSM
ncbi:hypothetical protein MW887_000670 [Aspergillus wentii]|nr:hypothetical protein MW887_000670 [Aspergillus wentii]